MTFVLMFLGKYWKILVIGVLVAIIAYGVVDYFSQRERISRLNAELVECNKANAARRDKIAKYDEEYANFAKRLAESEKKRAETNKSLDKVINTVRIQPIPQKCEAAIDWAVKNKDDLSWPK